MQGQWEKLQRPIAMTTAREVLHQRNLNRRQVSTWTSTAYVTETAVETYDDVLTSTIYVTPTRSYTTTIIYTFTSAPNARTTVSVTSTVSAGGQEITPATGGDTSPTPAPSSESLSTGARAGIGAGAGAAGLILIAILALFWRRRQKKNKAETQMMISNAIAAATGTAPGGTQSPLPDKQPQLLGGYVPPPPAQHDRFSDPIPVYHSGHGSPVMLSGHSSPAPIYQPEPHRDAYSPSQDPSPNHELSGTPAVTPPMVRYEYPRPPSPMQAAQGGYGVPQEMSGVRSPGMMYRDTGPYSN
jgi:hypothetical protein